MCEVALIPSTTKKKLPKVISKINESKPSATTPIIAAFQKAKKSPPPPPGWPPPLECWGPRNQTVMIVSGIIVILSATEQLGMFISSGVHARLVCSAKSLQYE